MLDMSVCGLDECGRGALAGPLVAAAVVLTTPRQTISRLAKVKLGRFNGKSALVRSVINADAIIPATIAAGIVAKVERDKLMLALHKEFPKYGWKTNTGHGTKAHFLAIEAWGMTKYHRTVFVTTALKNSNGL